MAGRELVDHLACREGVGRIAAYHSDRHGALSTESEERDRRKYLRNQEVVVPFDLGHEVEAGRDLGRHVGCDVRRGGEEEAAVRPPSGVHARRRGLLLRGAGKPRAQCDQQPAPPEITGLRILTPGETMSASLRMVWTRS